MAQARKIDSTQIDFLADFSSTLSFVDIPKPVIDAAKRFLADTCAVAIASKVAPSTEAIIKTAKQWDGGANGTARVLGEKDLLLTPANAAFVNGYKAHCLEWDALHEDGIAIAFCTPIGALHAECESREVSGKRFLSAVIAAAEFFILLGLGSGSTANFFRPSAGGTISAAIAIAHIRNYSPEMTKRTIGLAYSLASGTMQAHWEGVATLAMQVGTAARNAIYAADLAANDIAAPSDIFSGRFGFYSIFEKPGNFNQRLKGLGTNWHLPEVAYKPFPCGRATQGVLTMLREMNTEGDIHHARIETINVIAPPLISVLVNRPIKPEMSPSYARLCLPYILALYLSDGENNPCKFGNIVRPTDQEYSIANKLNFITNQQLASNILAPIEMTINMRDGKTLHQVCQSPWGAPDNPFTDRHLLEKIEKCLEYGTLNATPENFLSQFLQLEHSSDLKTATNLLYT